MVAVDALALHTIITVAVVHVCTKEGAWSQLQTPRQPKRKSFIYTWIMYITLVVFFVLELQRPQPNHYQLLGVTSRTPRYRIALKYTEFLKHFSPERLAQMNMKERALAEQTINPMRLAFDTLLDETRRMTYDHFGDMSSDGISLPETTGISVIALAIALHVVCFVLTYFGTLPARFKQARTFAAMFSVAAFGLELHWRFLMVQKTDWISENIPLLSELLPFERVELTRRCFPSFLGFMLALSNWLFVDKNGAILRLLHANVISDAMLLKSLGTLLRNNDVVIDNSDSSSTNQNSQDKKDIKSTKNVLKSKKLETNNNNSSAFSNAHIERAMDEETTPILTEEQPATASFLGFGLNQLLFLGVILIASYFWQH